MLVSYAITWVEGQLGPVAEITIGLTRFSNNDI
jgi:hypothetical protein